MRTRIDTSHGQQRNYHRFIWWVTLLLIFLIAAPGCSSKVRATRANIAHVNRVAIFPFDNLTGGSRGAADQMTAVFLGKILSVPGLEPVDLGEVQAFVREEVIRSSSDLTLDSLAKMGRRLNVQAVIVGTIGEYGYVTEMGEQVPVVGLSVRMLDVNSGRVLWTATHSRQGNDKETLFGMGRIASLTRLGERVLQDVTKSLARAKQASAKAATRAAKTPAGRSAAKRQTPGRSTTKPNQSTTPKATIPRRVRSRTSELNTEEKEEIRERARELWNEIGK